MNRLIAVGVTIFGGVIIFRSLPRESRHRLIASASHWIAKHMEQMMVNLPENAPPKLVMSILPKLQAQNDQIIAMLREQNELLREQHRTERM